ncbi:MAG: DUF2336 domain-containing protein [Cytophagaceae bacterium]|nr:MAG: DUF2336 domain-containing protein [Cytophagaceae bacterium]
MPALVADLPNLETSDEAARVRLAARSSTSPTLLNRLAQDPAVTVRAAVAMNTTFAPEAAQHLLTDSDDRVRALLADKVARLLPGLPRTEHCAAYDHVYSILRELAHDAALRVRRAISDIVHGMPDVPRDIILLLANDPITEVSEPILRLSPLLTDIDLLELLMTPPHSKAALAVASRPDLSHELCHFIATECGSVAVSALLRNSSAMLGEATLDALIGRAGDYPEWHDPLVRRPGLPDRAVRALATIVSKQLLSVLLARPDLPTSLIEELGSLVEINLARSNISHLKVSEEDFMANLVHLHSTHQLNDDYLLHAAATGNIKEVRSILVICSHLTEKMLNRAISLRSPKALLSITWRAGFSASAGEAVQIVLGHLNGNEILRRTSDGGFVLSEDEMEWQLELLNEPERHA